jgi:hypothetical protein
MPNRHFDFEITDFDDVTEHLDALWYEFNAIVQALSTKIALPPECTDPPDTCGGSIHQSRKRPGRSRRTKRSAKKAKR